MDVDPHVIIPESASPFCEPTRTSTDGSRAPFDEQELIVKHLGLVQAAVNHIKRRVPAHVDADDLYSMGVAGLMAAVRKFDPANERTFARFATIRIRGAILDGLRRTDHSSRRNRLRARELEAAINAVEQRLGRAATPRDMCDSLGLSREEYSRWVEDAKPVKVLALDREIEGDRGPGSSLYNALVDANDETGREQMEKAELVELLTKYITGLPEVPRKILAMYYFENLRFSAIAEAFDLTEARISQIHRGTIQGLRKWMKSACEK